MCIRDRFYAAFYFISIYPHILHERPENAAQLLCLVAILFVVYAMLVLFFKFYLDHMETAQNMALFRNQMSASRNQYDAIRSGHQRDAVERNDAMHSLDTVVALLEGGDEKAALQFIHQLQSDAAKEPAPVYCENHVLNLILGFYLERAKAEGIQVDADIRAPEILPVDVLELAAALTSAIDAVMEGCRRFPPDAAPRLRVRCYVKQKKIGRAHV